MSTIRVITFDRSTGNTRKGGIELLPEAPLPDSSWMWVDIADENDESDATALMERLGLPKNAMQDARRTRHPPKIELLDEYMFLLLREIVPAQTDRDPDISQLSLFANTQVIVSVHRPRSEVIEKIMSAVDSTAGIAAKGTGNLLYLICRRLADECEPVILAHEQELAGIEDELFEKADDSALEVLSKLNRVLRRLRRILAYQAVVFERLQQKFKEKIVPLGKHEATDLLENMDRLATLCQLNQELAVDLLNTHLAIASHRLNVVMRVLTVATIVFLPLGLMAGIYGMNFEFMPELSWKYAYFTLLGLMATVATALVVYFRKKSWL